MKQIALLAIVLTVTIGCNQVPTRSSINSGIVSDSIAPLDSFAADTSYHLPMDSISATKDTAIWN